MSDETGGVNNSTRSSHEMLFEPVECPVEAFPFTGYLREALFHILYRLRKHGWNVEFTSKRFQTARDGC